MNKRQTIITLIAASIVVAPFWLQAVQMNQCVAYTAKLAPQSWGAAALRAQAVRRCNGGSV